MMENYNIFNIFSIVIILNVIIYNHNIYKLYCFIKKFQIKIFYNLFDKHYLKKVLTSENTQISPLKEKTEPILILDHCLL